MHFPQKGLSVTCRCLDRLGEELTENPTFQAAPNRVGQQVAVNLLSVTSLCKEILTRPRSSQGIGSGPRMRRSASNTSRSTVSA